MGRHGRLRHAARCALATLAGLVALATAATTPAAAAPPAGRPPAEIAGIPLPPAAARGGAAAGLASTWERQRSRAAHRGLRAAAALALARRSFPALLRGTRFDGREPAPGMNVVRQLGRGRALVEEERTGQRFVVSSTVELESSVGAGTPLPVDLGLVQTPAGFEVQNPHVPVRIAADDGRLTVGDGVSLALAGADDTTAVPTDDRVFLSNVALDTDEILTPTATGVELSLQLRSPASPERFVLAVTLPDGAVLRRARAKRPIPGDPPESLEVARGDDVLAYVRPPLAFDADGQSVPVSMHADGNRIVLEAKHRGLDLQYPALLDPEVIARNGFWEGWSRWWWAQNLKGGVPGNPSGFGMAKNDCAYHCGLYTSMPTNNYFQNGAYANFYYKVPNATFLYRVILDNIAHEPTDWYDPWGGCCTIYSAWFNGMVDNTGLAYEGNAGYVNRWGGTGPNPFWGANADSGVRHDFCINPRCFVDHDTPSEGNSALVGIQAYNRYNNNVVGTLEDKASVTVDRTEVFLGDRRAPQLPQGRLPDQPWVDDKGDAHSITFTGYDEGLGLRTVGMSGAASQDPPKYYSCTGDPDHSPCPWQVSETFSYRLDEGETRLRIYAEDIVGNPASHEWTARVDRSDPPAPTLSGSLLEGAKRALKSGEYEVVASGVDSLSGVNRIVIKHDDFLVADTGWMDAAGGERRELRWKLVPYSEHFADGGHRVTVEVTDEVGRRSSRSFDYFLDLGGREGQRLADEPDSGPDLVLPDPPAEEECSDDPEHPAFCGNTDPGNTALQQVLSEPSINVDPSDDEEPEDAGGASFSTRSSHDDPERATPWGIADEHAHFLTEEHRARFEQFQLRYVRLTVPWDVEWRQFPDNDGSPTDGNRYEKDQTGSGACPMGSPFAPPSPTERYDERRGILRCFLRRVKDHNNRMAAAGQPWRQLRVMVAFNKTREPRVLTPGAAPTPPNIDLPSRTEYEAAVRDFVARYSANYDESSIYAKVNSYAAWNEPNLPNRKIDGTRLPSGGQPTYGDIPAAVRFFRILRTVCGSNCSVAAGEFSDTTGGLNKNYGWIGDYIQEMRSQIRLNGGPQAVLWSTHAYRDGDCRQLRGVRNLLKATRGKLWLTEQGGRVYTRGSIHRDEANCGDDTPPADGEPQQETDANGALAWILGMPREINDRNPNSAQHARWSRRISRTYVYHWQIPHDAKDHDSALLQEVIAPDGSRTLEERAMFATFRDATRLPFNYQRPRLTHDGTPRDGETIQTTVGEWTNLPETNPQYSYEWLRCDGSTCQPISGATGSSYTLRPDDADRRIRSRVTATNAFGFKQTVSRRTPVVTGRPVENQTRPRLSGSTRVGEYIETDNGAWRYLANAGTYAYQYQWLRCDTAGANCAEIAGATNKRHLNAAADRGTTLRARVTADNKWGDPASATSDPSNRITNPPPSNTAPPQASGEPAPGKFVQTSNNGTWANDPASYSWHWHSCGAANDPGTCVPVEPEQTGDTLYQVQAADRGRYLRVLVRAFNDGGSGAAWSNALGPVTDPPTNTSAPTVGGTARERETLTVANGTWTSSPTGYSYEWRRCDTAGLNCSAISGATASTYVLQAADVDRTVRAVVTARNVGGSSAPALSPPTAVVLTGKPTVVTAPSITGAATESATLTGNTGSWTNAPTSYTRQWRRCDASGGSCADIAGATAATFATSTDDLGKTLRLVVTATNPSGSTAATSAAFGPVKWASGRPTNTSAPSVSGSTNVGDVLTATNGGWLDATSLRHQWKRTPTGGTATAISGATTPTYTLTSADADATISVTVTAVNAAGETESTSPVTATVLVRRFADNPVARVGFEGKVNDVAHTGAGTAYVAGDFSAAGLPTGPAATISAADGGAITSPGIRCDPALGATGTEPPATCGRVHAVEPDGRGGWYIGGEFNKVGSVPARNLARITSTGAVDASFKPNPDGPVFALFFSEDDGLFVGGAFATVSGAAHQNVALIDVYDGRAFPAWEASVNGPVYAMTGAAQTGNLVYVGGDFTSVNGQSASRLAAITHASGETRRWNASANGTVRALEHSGYTIYAGGDFTQLNGAARNRVGAIDEGGSLVSAGTGGWSADGTVRSLTVDGTSVYIGGDFATVGGQPRSSIAALATSNGTVLPWNPGANGAVHAVAASGGTVYAGGAFTTLGGAARMRIGAVSGSTGAVSAWSPRAGDLVRALATDGTKVQAGGDFTVMLAVARKNLAEVRLSDGAITGWDPQANDGVDTIDTIGTTAFVGGRFTAIGAAPRSRIAAVGPNSLATTWNPGADGRVRAISITGAGWIHMGGDFQNVAGTPRPYLAAVGSGGTLAAWNPSPNGPVHAIRATSQWGAYVGGSFTTIGGQSRPYVARVEPDAWINTWNPSPNAPVDAIEVAPGKVYLGGSFTAVGGLTRRYVAEIGAVNQTGSGAVTSWNPSVDSPVAALAVQGTDAYLGGRYVAPFAPEAHQRCCLRAVDSAGAFTAWTPNNMIPVRAMAMSPSTLVVAGLGLADVSIYRAP
jgi:hypothetical protein